ncbi:MAG: Hsp70 family protein [Sulfuriflexus sp.]|nr:Hsp70 family protein [Sulfuriflexus sp.]
MSFCGLDFGTSNSAIGVVNHDEVAMIPLESGESLIRTAIFIDDEEKAFLYGREGVNSYLDGDEGRLMLSIKSVLGTPLMHEKTNVLNEMVPFTSIIGLFISEVKKRAEQVCGYDITDVVLGRPVRFNDDNDELDAQAENAMREVAEKQGFKNIEFQLEPIAAAKAFQSNHHIEGNLLIVDIGGGTSDFTILRSNTSNPGQDFEILGTAGIHLGGTNLDQVLALNKVMPELGMNSFMRTMNGTDITIPSAWFHQLSTWHEINRLYDPSTIKSIQHALISTLDKNRTDRLIKALKEKQGHRILEDVEHCKRRLSDSGTAGISLDAIEVGLNIEVGKGELEQAIGPTISSIRDKINELVTQCGLRNDNIDYVFYTGGTTLIPMVQNTINQMLPNAKALTGDMLHSVGIGLTLDAKEKFR